MIFPNAVANDMVNTRNTIEPTQNLNNITDLSSAIEADRKWSEEQAKKQMDFQERLSSTAYQRAVKDLQKAGLNPALAYMQGGSSTATGSKAETTSNMADSYIQIQKDNANLLRQVISGLFGVITKSTPAATTITSVKK